MRYVFSIKKYREWRMIFEGLNDETIDFIIANHHMHSQDGMDRNELIDRGYIVLKSWCDEINESEKN